MRRSYNDDDYTSRNTSSLDYHDHILNLARMQSTNISTDVPRYRLASPRFFHAPKAVDFRPTEEIKEEEEYNSIKTNNNNNRQKKKKQQQHPQFEDKVEIIGYSNGGATDENVTKSTTSHNNNNKKKNTATRTDVSEGSSINDEATNYIQQKRKAFDLFKWKASFAH